MDFDDIKKVDPLTWGFVVMFVLVTIVPGLLLLFIFDKQLFMEIETIKVLFLSISITLPFWALNTFMCLLYDDKDNKNQTVKNQLQLSGLLGAIFSFIPLYVPVIVILFVDLDYKVAAWIAIGLEILILIFLRLDYTKTKKSEQNGNGDKQ